MGTLETQARRSIIAIRVPCSLAEKGGILLTSRWATRSISSTKVDASAVKLLQGQTAMTEWFSHDHKPDAPSGSSAMTDATLWTLVKGPNRARAISRSVPGVGVELRFTWNDDTRSTQVYRNVIELAAVANAKREELIAAGWADAPPPAFPNYEAGTWGPEAAAELLRKDGREWRRP